MPVHGKRAVSCGRSQHGKEPAAAGGALLCFACWRPGPRDESSIRWIQVGSCPYWAELWKWSTAVGAKWSHERDLKAAPLKSESAFVAGLSVCVACTTTSSCNA
ncbi:unnamed protein product [Pylaiella littoralis]